jgi:hypothetical protein
MKKLIFISIVILSLSSCKTSQTVSNLDRNGFEVAYIGYNPQDSIYEKYPVSDSDSLEYHYDSASNQTLVYIVEETRYVVLSENFELIRIESK